MLRIVRPRISSPQSHRKAFQSIEIWHASAKPVPNKSGFTVAARLSAPLPPADLALCGNRKFGYRWRRSTNS